MLLHAALILLHIQQPVRFSSKFVPVPSVGHYRLNDARKDLSALGYSENHGGDWIMEMGLCVIKGRSYPLEKNGPVLDWIPAAFLPEGRIALTHRDSTAARSASVAHGRVSAGRTIASGDLSPSLRILPGAEEPMKFPQEWRSKSGGYAMSDLLVRSFVCEAYTLGDGVYDTGDGTMVFYAAEHHFPLFRRKDGAFRPLIDCVDAKGVSIGEILFVSPEGWLVVEGLRGKESGLVWLYPKNR